MPKSPQSKSNSRSATAASEKEQIEEFLKRKAHAYVQCKKMGKARIQWKECAARYTRKRMIKSFGRKMEQYASPQDKLCRQCEKGAIRAQRVR